MATKGVKKVEVTKNWLRVTFNSDGKDGRSFYDGDTYQFILTGFF